MSRVPESCVAHAINRVRAHKQQPPMPRIGPETRLREDCGFDSMDLAELTVIVEHETGFDLFAEGPVRTVGEAVRKMGRREDGKMRRWGNEETVEKVGKVQS